VLKFKKNNSGDRRLRVCTGPTAVRNVLDQIIMLLPVGIYCNGKKDGVNETQTSVYSTFPSTYMRHLIWFKGHSFRTQTPNLDHYTRIMRSWLNYQVYVQKMETKRQRTVNGVGVVVIPIRGAQLL